MVILFEEEIYCEVHGTAHEPTENPYQYHYGDDEEPECSEKDWRILWVGRYVETKP